MSLSRVRVEGILVSSKINSCRLIEETLDRILEYRIKLELMYTNLIITSDGKLEKVWNNDMAKELYEEAVELSKYFQGVLNIENNKRQIRI